jgi:hypothetical protein
MDTWRASLTEKEKALHELAAVKLKAENAKEGDSGSYFPEKCRAFVSWLKKHEAEKGANGNPVKRSGTSS